MWYQHYVPLSLCVRGLKIWQCYVLFGLSTMLTLHVDFLVLTMSILFEEFMFYVIINIT